MIKKHLLKVTLVTTVIAALLTATACGSRQTSDNSSVQQTTEAVKVVSNVDVKSESDKKESEKKGEAEQTIEVKEEASGDTTEEAREEAADNAEHNDEAVSEDVNEASEYKEAVNEPQNTEAPAQEEQEAPAEAPAEDNNAAAVDTAPVEQPVTPEPSPAPEPVVTPQESAKPSVTQEQQLVATGKWVKEDEITLDGVLCTYYVYNDSISRYSMEACFADGAFHHEQYDCEEAENAIFSAHGITDRVTSFDRLMKLSNS